MVQCCRGDPSSSSRSTAAAVALASNWRRSLAARTAMPLPDRLARRCHGRPRHRCATRAWQHPSPGTTNGAYCVRGLNVAGCTPPRPSRVRVGLEHTHPHRPAGRPSSTRKGSRFPPHLTAPRPLGTPPLLHEKTWRPPPRQSWGPGATLPPRELVASLSAPHATSRDQEEKSTSVPALGSPSSRTAPRPTASEGDRSG